MEGRILPAFVPALVIVAAIRPCAAQQQTSTTTIEFQDMSFELPGSDWSRTENGKQIDLTRSAKPSHRQSLSMWPVRFPESLRGLTQIMHARQYFDFERGQQRPKEVDWRNFVETVRTIGGVQYPIIWSAASRKPRCWKLQNQMT